MTDIIPYQGNIPPRAEFQDPASCHLSNKKCRQPNSRVARWALLPTSPLRTGRDPFGVIRLKPPQGAFPHPASLRLTVGDALVCDN